MRRILAASLLIAGSFACGCGGRTCYSSPGEVMAAEQAAYKNGDWNTYVDCFTPKAQEKAVQFMVPFYLIAGSAIPLKVTGESKDGKPTITGKGSLTIAPVKSDFKTMCPPSTD